MSKELVAEDDGLPCPDVGSWAEKKYRLLSLYDELFSTGMKNKWDQRVYIDLYAGAGYARVKGKKKRAMVKGGKAGYSPNWKKAIVTTDKPIVLFEGV